MKPLEFQSIITSQYENWLAKISSYRDSPDFVLRPSRAGSCYKIHKYYQIKTLPAPIPGANLRRMRMGTILHTDIMHATSSNMNKYYVFNELDLEAGSIKGTADGVCIEIRNGKIKETVLYDIKTVGAYQYKKMFGRVKSPESHSRYKLQLATYALLFPGEINNMFLVYVCIDSGMIKVIEVESSWILEAKRYWDEVQLALKRDVSEMEKGDTNIPIEKWECKYCRFSYICLEKDDDDKNTKKNKKSST